MPDRNLTVISVKSALYWGLSAASEFCHTPSRPRLGSMYQSVSRAACCRPFDWLPALMAQILNQPAFLMVPSGFSKIRVSLRGRLASNPCAAATPGRSPALPQTIAASTVPFSLIGRSPQSNARKQASPARDPETSVLGSLEADATPLGPATTNQICGEATPLQQIFWLPFQRRSFSIGRCSATS